MTSVFLCSRQLNKVFKMYVLRYLVFSLANFLHVYANDGKEKPEATLSDSDDEPTQIESIDCEISSHVCKPSGISVVDSDLNELAVIR